MGRSYDSSGRLACDGCGKAEGTTRRRTCPARVVYPSGASLPYCAAPDLCPDCVVKHRDRLHVGCREAAAKRTAEERARGARLEAGEMLLRSCWGDWHERVPAGWVGACFVGKGDAVAYWLVPAKVYDRRGRDDSPGDFARVAVEMGEPELRPWGGPDDEGTTTKEARVVARVVVPAPASALRFVVENELPLFGAGG